MMNTLYKERFPKATQQMEERLQAFIDEYGRSAGGDGMDAGMDADVPADAIAIVRFVQHQTVELGRDCLQKSSQKLITSRYFYEMSENVERLLAEAKEKALDAVPHLSRIVRRLLLIISRPARLLECLEFDPEEFYHMLEEAEGQVRITEGVTDFPQYIVTQLGLNRDPLAELEHDICQLEEKAAIKSSTPVKKTPTTPYEDDYELVKLISNGAYGAVYLVRHRHSRQRFAMKKINKQNLLLRNQVEQAFAERDILCFTDNPFVVSLQCSFETKKHLCMVMEYVEGGDCATLLKNMGPFPCDMARFYFAETVLAVEYLHSYGIVHRDLKPDNLLITALGHIKLTDFGLSKMGLMSLATNLYEGFIDRETREFSDKQVFGTPEYIAPEVVLRQGYGKPVDWWASGIILYEFLIGCVPFFGETPEELFSHVVNDDIEWPSESDWPVQPEAKDLITALLQQNPRDRLATGGGGAEVKMHPFFDGLDWNSLLRLKAEFVPQLNDEEDTSYFDARADRYCHDVAADDTDEPLDAEAPLFGSFSSCSPRYKKSHGLFLLHDDDTSATAAAAAAAQNDEIPPATATPVAPGANDSGASDLSVDSCGSLGEDKLSISSAEVMGVVERLAPPTQVTDAESSQTENEESSPQIQRRRKLHHELKSLPRFSICMDDVYLCDASGGASGLSPADHIRELSPVEERPVETATGAPSAPLPSQSASPGDTSGDPSFRPEGLSTGTRPKLQHSPCGGVSQRRLSRSGVSKSNSMATGLSLVIPLDESFRSAQSPGGGSSTASSRDTSPCRELSPTISTLKPAIVLRRGARGFGFTLRAIRVYMGDSDFYTVHHLVMAVDDASPALEAGLRPGDLITHINGEPVQGLFHTQVLQLIMSEGDRVTLRATPLDQTSIQTGGRRRELAKSRLARRSHHHRLTHGGHTRRPPGGKVKADQTERRRKTSLFRRLSSKRASAEIQQLAAGGSSSPIMTPSRSFQSLSRSLPASHDSGSNSPTRAGSAGSAGSGAGGYSPPILRHQHQHQHHQHHISPSDSPRSTPSSSPSSSTPNSPASGQFHPHFPRPSSLHGLKNKLHSVAKNMHSPSRRKSAGHIPLSPLARTPSPSPQPPMIPVSPTRSPSPLAFPMVHPPGSSHSTQVFSPGASLSVSPAAKRAMSRPKSAEPGSPLLRRALSPDRLHPRSAEKSLAISPLCGSNSSAVPKVTVISPPRVTILASQSTPEAEAITSSGGGGGSETLPAAEMAQALPEARRGPADLFHRSELTVELRKPTPRSRSTSPIPVTVANVTVDPCVLAAAAASAEVRRRRSPSHPVDD